MPILIWLLSLLLFAISSNSALANKPLVLSDSQEKYYLGPYLETLEDPSRQWNLETVRSEQHQQFQLSQSQTPSFGFTSSAIWAKLHLQNDDQPRRLYLSVRYTGHDTIDLYQIHSSGEVSQQWAGRSHPFYDATHPNRRPTFLLVLEPHETTQIYLRFQSDGYMTFPLYLETESEWSFSKTAENLAWGGLFGALVSIVIHNFFMFLSIRSLNNLYYVLFIIAGFVFNAVEEGYAFQYFWPGSPWWGKHAYLVTTIAVIWAALLFSTHFLQLKTRAPFFHKTLQTAFLFSCIFIFSSFLLKYHIMIQIITFFGGYVLLSLPLFGALSWKRGFLPAQYYMLGFGSLAIMCFAKMASTYGWIPYGMFNGFEVYSGFVAITILLLTALAKQIQAIRSEKEQAQTQAIEHLEKYNQFKDQFLANTSHELRTPLNGIIGLADSLAGGVYGKLPDDVTSDLSLIAYNGRRLYRLVNDLLDIEKLKHHSLLIYQEPTHLKQVVDTVCLFCQPLLRDKKKSTQQQILVQNLVPADFAPVHVDPNRLQQILYNLIGNAIKFTDKGTVTIEASLQNEKDESGAEWVSIAVRDTGMGIPQEQQEKVFQLFEQGHQPPDHYQSGTGLGLSISQQLVELHGGHMSVESAVGKGSCFSFTMPVSQETPTSEENKRPTDILMELSPQEQEEFAEDVSPIKHGKAHILVVDDEHVNRHILFKHLTHHGYKVSTANDGKEALQMIGSHQPGDDPFDFVLLDIMMPELSGLEACEQIRKQYGPEELPILFLTAKSQTSDVIKGFQVGGNDYVSKPFYPPELLKRIETHLYLHENRQRLMSLKAFANRLGQIKGVTDLSQELFSHLSKHVSSSEKSILKDGEQQLANELLTSVTDHPNQETFVFNHIASNDSWKGSLPWDSGHALYIRMQQDKEDDICLYRNEQEAPFSAFDVDYAQTLLEQSRLTQSQIQSVALDTTLIVALAEILPNLSKITHISGKAPYGEVFFRGFTDPQAIIRISMERLALYFDQKTLVRVHNSHMVHQDRILYAKYQSSSKQYHIFLEGTKTPIPLGRAYTASFKQNFPQFFK